MSHRKQRNRRSRDRPPSRGNRASRVRRIRGSPDRAGTTDGVLTAMFANASSPPRTGPSQRRPRPENRSVSTRTIPRTRRRPSGPVPAGGVAGRRRRSTKSGSTIPTASERYRRLMVCGTFFGSGSRQQEQEFRGGKNRLVRPSVNTLFSLCRNHQNSDAAVASPPVHV